MYRPGCFEHFVLHNLRDDECFIKELDYVIEIDNKIIGSIVYAKGNLKLDNGGMQEILLFGPVGVLPEYQQRGYGKALISYTMQKAKELGYNEIIFYEGMDKSEEFPVFMVCVLNDGVYSDPDCYFKIDLNELEEFDKKFPEKVKEKREGQLE